ncbi:hypothetical protein LTR53_008548, partial [Teratosphaeriaceae sp. CCFEE 6253]
MSSLMLPSLALRRAHGQLQVQRRWLATFAFKASSTQNTTRTGGARHLLIGLRDPQCVRRFSTTPRVSSARSNAIWRSQNRKKPPAAHQAVPEEHLELASDFHEAISDVDIKNVITLFPELQKRGLIDRTLTWRTAQCLHESFRRHRRLPAHQRVRADSEEMVEFAGRLANAIVKAEVEPDRRGHVHILTFFKEAQAHSEGVKFWTWLEEQSDEHVGIEVYGAAIELLAVQGTPLSELECLYERALQRFPAGFNAYHLSPHAVVPDRNQAIQIK